MSRLHDVAVVGGGLLGLAASRALTARGRDVVLLEQAEPGHQGSGSKGSCRIFRLGYPDPGYVVAARRSRELWRQLEQESGRLIVLPEPQLSFGSGLQLVQDAMHRAGAPCELLPAAEVTERWPAMQVGGPALLEPDSGVLAADQALGALAAGLPDIRAGVRVTSLADDGRAVTLRTSIGPVTARTAIITAGPWSSRLLASAGIALPGQATLEQVGYLGPADPTASGPRAPIFVCHAAASPYGLPVPGSPLYKIGIHPSGPATDPDSQDQSADARLVSRLSDVARRYLPGYDPVPAATERCIYDNTPDSDFVLDRAGNVVIGCGTSGHGFKFGPLLGEWLADLADQPGAAPDHRFALGRPGLRGLP